jgi:DNA-3-methyladenine glycosylase I
MEIKKMKGSFTNYIWEFVSGEQIVNQYKSLSEIPNQTNLSANICKDLKQNGFKFVGPTVVYSFMQAIGMVNDHLVDCFRYTEVLSER